MSKQIEEHIQRVAHSLVDEEVRKLSVLEVKPSLADIVSAGYEQWVKLLDAYRATGKRDGYNYLAGLLSQTYGLKVNAAALRKAVSNVRKRRGERVFKGSGVPFKNLHWGTV